MLFRPQILVRRASGDFLLLNSRPRRPPVSRTLGRHDALLRAGRIRTVLVMVETRLGGGTLARGGTFDDKDNNDDDDDFQGSDG